MNQEESIRLIELYQTYRFLWDAKEKSHHNRAKREDAWKEMSKKMNHPVATLKAKIKSLMGSYRSEKSREKKTQVTGSGSDDIYESKWFAYKYFAFLGDKDSPRETVDTENAARQEREPEMEVPTSPATPSGRAAAATSAANSSETVISTPSINRVKKTGVKRKAADYNAESKMMEDALQVLKSSANASNDPYYTYALNLGNELRKYDQRTFAHVKHEFAKILFDADMGKFSEPASYDTMEQPPQRCPSRFSTKSSATSQEGMTHTSFDAPSLHGSFSPKEESSSSSQFNPLSPHYTALSVEECAESMVVQQRLGSSGDILKEAMQVLGSFD